MKCSECGAAIDEQTTRIVFMDETQVCHWGGEIAEVEIQSARVLGEYCGEACADTALALYLSTAGAVATWADVRPIESCAICGNDFPTDRPHRVLTLSKETGPETDPEKVDVYYPARFCPGCAPLVPAKSKG